MQNLSGWIYNHTFYPQLVDLGFSWLIYDVGVFFFATAMNSMYHAL